MKSYIYKFHKEAMANQSSLKIIGEKESYSGKESFEIIKKLVVFFDKIGIKRNSRVAVISLNEPYFIFTIFALMYLRAIPVSIDRSLDDETLKILLRDEEYLFSDKKINYFKSQSFNLKKIFSFSKKLIINQEEFLRVIEKNDFSDSKTKDPAIILCSSGTTGIPKKVVLSEENMFWADREYARLYKFRENKSIAFIVPSHYSLGILACGIVPFSHRKTIFIANGKKLVYCLKMTSSLGINILPATPMFYNMANKINLNKYDFSKLKICDSGGQALPVAIINKFKEQTKIIITEGYGLTETSSLTHFLVKDDSGKFRLGSMGRPCRGVVCKIVNKQGKRVENYVPGELLVKGPQNMLRYDNPVYNRKIFLKGGWLRTGDIVYKDEDSFYYYVSRKVDIGTLSYRKTKVIRDFEEYLYNVVEIEECAVLVKEGGGIIIFIKPIKNLIINNEVRDEIVHDLKKLFTDFEIRFVYWIPRTSTNKVKRNSLRLVC